MRTLSGFVMVELDPLPKSAGTIALPDELGKDFEHCWAAVLAVANDETVYRAGDRVLVDRNAPRRANLPGGRAVRVISREDIKGVPRNADNIPTGLSDTIVPSGTRIFIRWIDEDEFNGVALPVGHRYTPLHRAEVLAVHPKSEFSVGQQVVVDERMAAEISTPEWGLFWAIKEEYITALVEQ